MVDMGMGQDDEVHLLGIDHGVAVGRIGLQSLALKHSTIQQDLLAMVCGD